MAKRGRSFWLITQGCKINQYESQALSESWQVHGARQAGDVKQAEIIVINSCAVTARALQDLRKIIHRCRQVNRSAHMVVTGCAAQMCPEDMGDLSDVDRVVPQEEKFALTQWPPTNWPGSTCAAKVNEQTSFPAFHISHYSRARPVVKVQDGCSHRCTYCIVPLTRGPSRSRDPQEVAAEVENLLASGHRELVLSGINLAHYRSLGMDFWDLVQFLDSRLGPKWQDRARLRLSSLDPSQLGAKALDVLAGSRMLCPHLHLSIQSASPRVLKAMGRSHYHPDRVAAFVDQLDGVWPCFALGGDFLVGFPGETEHDMQRTEDWLAAQPFTYAHVFTYSPRPGTPAARAGGQVGAEVKKIRSQKLRDMAEIKGQEFAGRLLLLPKLHVLLETGDPGAGRCEYYVSCAFDLQPFAEVKSLAPAIPVQVQGSALKVRPA
ncbi:MAG: MiaB/RimO family radical SAM methylthiotransferase [Desulfovermiculus sp.]